METVRNMALFRNDVFLGFSRHYLLGVWHTTGAAFLLCEGPALLGWATSSTLLIFLKLLKNPLGHLVNLTFVCLAVDQQACIGQ